MAKQKTQKQGFRTSIGGQALMEGILMRGPDRQAIVIRKPDGEFATKVEELELVRDKHPILGLPLLRGGVTFLDSMVKGVAALTYSAEFLPEDEQEEPSKFDKWIEKKLGWEKAQKVIIYLAVAIGVCLSVGLFILLPTILAGLFTDAAAHPVLRNLIEGLIDRKSVV